MASLDREKARAFIEQNGGALDRLRLAHWLGHTDEETLWQRLASFQNPDGGWAFGIDPDYRGAASSIHSTLAALRVFMSHRLRGNSRARQTLSFLQRHARDDGTWCELPEVRDFDPPPWYEPTRYRIWETGCIAGYCARLGHDGFTAPAIDYVRDALGEMPPSETAHPHIAGMLLLGADEAPASAAAWRSCREVIEERVERQHLDPWDAVMVLESMLLTSVDLLDSLLHELVDLIIAYQHPDGGLVTAYGDHLRVETTLYAWHVFTELERL